MNFVFMVLIFLFIALCIVLAFLSGYAIAVIKGVPSFQKASPELSEAEKQKIAKQRKEYENFLSFDGDSQE